MEDQVAVEAVPVVEDEYTQFVNALNDEVTQFIAIARAGKTSRPAALSARKQSVVIRYKLKDFRQVSLDNDQKMKEILQEKKAAVKKTETTDNVG